MRKIKKFFIIILILIVLIEIFASHISEANNNLDLSKLEATNIGIGGGGVLHSPVISPFDVNTMAVVPDMGGIYISHNSGKTWKRKNLKGLNEKVYFDPNRQGVVYAGGTGLWKSTDNGDNFEMIFPKPEDVIARRYNRDDMRQYIYTKDKYPFEKSVKDIIVNPNNSDNIFILMYFGKNGTVFESTDNGETFKELFSYTKKTSANNIWQDFNKLMYAKETNTLYYVTQDGVYKYNTETKKADEIYSSMNGLVNIVQVFENGKTKFIVIENSTQIEKCQTQIYYTEDEFKSKVDLTTKVIKDLPDSFDAGKYKDVQYNWRFIYLDATSTSNIYVTHNNMSNNSSYPYRIAGLIHYDGEKGTWAYGHPYKNHASEALVAKGWNDGNIHSYGVHLSQKDGKTLLYTTLCGIYYSPDGEKFYQRYTTKIEGSNNKFVTNGIDEQTTYGVVTNPHDRNILLLLNSDLGMIRSEDNGKSWERALSGIKSEWTNSAYDAEFDKRENKKGVVYSLWSGRSTMPYNPGNETDGFCKRRFCYIN